MTLTAPAAETAPTSSPGTPTARSSWPSLSKSPTARAAEEVVLADPALEVVLVPESVADRGQAGGRAVDDVDGPGVGDGADVLAGDADGQVVEAVVVEVAGG